MAKLTLTDTASGYTSTQALNANNGLVEAAVENTLSRDGTTPNEMNANFDMNGFNILNQANPISVTGFNWEGPWLTSTLYETGDLVEDSGASYICIVEHTSGTFNADLSSAYWQLVVTANTGVYAYASKAVAVLIAPVAGRTISVGGDDGGLFEAVTGAAAATYADDGGAYCGTVFIPTGGDGSTAWVRVDTSSINILWFGAVGDGATDDRAAILVAVTAAVANAGTLYAPAGYEFYVSASTSLFGPTKIKWEGIITTALSTDEITFGLNSASSTPSDYHFHEARIGSLVAQGIMNGYVKVIRAPKLRLYADGSDALTKSIAYSTFDLGFINHLVLECQQNGGVVAWMNENTFYNGRIATFEILGDYKLNNNNFYSPRFEGATINVTIGNCNTFHGCRFEGTNTFTFGSTSFNNVFFQTWSNFTDIPFVGSNAATWNVTDNGKNNDIVQIQNTFIDRESSFEITPNSRNYPWSLFETDTAHTDLTIKANSTTFFDTGLLKIEDPIWYIFSSDASASSFQFYLEAYDVNKNKITTDPGSDFTTTFGAWIWNDTSDYYYISGGVAANNVSFPIYNQSSAVYYRVYARTSSTGVINNTMSYFRLQTAQKKTEDIHRNKPKNFLGQNRDGYVGTAAPTYGTFEQGDIVWKSDPEAFGNMGWLCTTAGTPGTWNGMGMIGGVSDSSRTFSSPTLTATAVSKVVTLDLVTFTSLDGVTNYALGSLLADARVSMGIKWISDSATNYTSTVALKADVSVGKAHNRTMEGVIGGVTELTKSSVSGSADITSAVLTFVSASVTEITLRLTMTLTGVTGANEADGYASISLNGSSAFAGDSDYAIKIVNT